MIIAGIGKLIGLSNNDLETPIYRIYDLTRFEEMLASRQNVLVNPSMWDDPFENFFLERTEVVDPNSVSTIPLKNLAKDWYGQCWSLNEDTDAMWRIYSPSPKEKNGSNSDRKIGVKVATTIGRLLNDLSAVGSPAPEQQFFVGKVKYHTEAEISEFMTDLTFFNISVGADGEHFAELLCIKREAFKHESEIRLIFQVHTTNTNQVGVGGIYKYPVDPNRMFDEVVLDPRLADSDVNEIRDRLAKQGCNLPIKKSTLYQAPSFIIPIQ